MTATAQPPARSTHVAKITLAVYSIALALIAVWPVPVDSGASGFLHRVGRVIPWATYSRIEFGANIALFVPLGVLLAIILTRRSLVVPIALVTTVTIESVQALALDRRTPSLFDIVANVTGAAIGLLLVVALEKWRARQGRPMP